LNHGSFLDCLPNLELILKGTKGSRKGSSRKPYQTSFKLAPLCATKPIFSFGQTFPFFPSAHHLSSLCIDDNNQKAF